MKEINSLQNLVIVPQGAYMSFILVLIVYLELFIFLGREWVLLS